MVDQAIVAARVAAIRDAVDRIRGVLPPETTSFAADRTTREVVIPARVHAIAATELGDLLDFCELLSRETGAGARD